jgi:hypothetical protein
MEEAQTKLTDEEITGIEKKIHAALYIEQFEEAEKWVKHLKRAGVDCEKIERKIGAFRHPEPYQGRLAWDSFPSKLYIIFQFIMKIMASFFLFLCLILAQMLLFSPYCHDPESASEFLGLSINNGFLLFGMLTFIYIFPLIKKFHRLYKSKHNLKREF